MKHLLSFFVLVLLALCVGNIVFAQMQPAGMEPGEVPTLKSQIFKQPPLKPLSAASTSLPLMISYQGLLTTSGGTPVADGGYDLTIALYDSIATGTVQWSEAHPAVPVHRGVFSMALGSVTPLNLQFNKSLFVQVTATAGPAGPSYPLTFSPRSQLLSAPYSLAPWVTNGTDIYYKNGKVAIGSTAPESVAIATLKMDIADEDGGNSDISQRVAGSGWGEYHFAKSRGTLESPTIVSNGDLLGGVNYLGWDGSTFQWGAGMYGFVDSTPAAGKMPLRLSFYSWDQTRNWSEKMRMDRNGNLTVDASGINGGLSSPGLNFGGPYSGEGIASKRTTGGNILGLDFYTAFAPRMSITNAGLVGIGTTSPFSALDVVRDQNGYYTAHVSNPDSTIAYGLLVESTNSTSPAGSNRYGIFSYAWYGANTNMAGEFWGYGGTYAYGVYGIASGATNTYGGYFSGNLAYTGSLINASDARFKENIRDYTGALSKIMEVKPRTFTFKTGSEYNRFSFSPGEHYGFVAQELEQVFPELVITAAQPPDRDEKGIAKGDPIEYKGVKTMEMIPILVQAIQEQQKLIEELQAKVDALQHK